MSKDEASPGPGSNCVGRRIVGASRLRPTPTTRAGIGSGTSRRALEPGRRAGEFAPVLVPIVADLARPVENQVVVPPGSTIRGKVVDAEGRAVADAAVGWIESLGGNAFELNRMTLTATDGTFKIGPLPTGEFRLTGLAESPRRLGKVTAKANQADVLIRLEPAPIPK